MSREIRFRAWDGKQMYSVKSVNKWRVLDLNKIRDGEAVMQFTGLTDKNGVEIYHKDLVSNGTNVFEVVWSKKFGGWAIVDRKTVKQQHHLLANSLKYQEIIGNTYENPELLNKE